MTSLDMQLAVTVLMLKIWSQFVTLPPKMSHMDTFCDFKILAGALISHYIKMISFLIKIGSLVLK